MSASTEFEVTARAAKARLNNVANDGSVGAWVAGTNDLNQWIKVSLFRQINITGVKIQGSPSTDQWVTKFRVDRSLGNDKWTPLTVDNNEIKVS